MTDERILPLPATGDLATFTISVAGSDLSSEVNIGHIIVRKEFSKISSATLVILDGDAAEQDFAVSNSDVFVPGKEVEISAGYHSQESLIYKGVIVSQGLKVRANKPTQLIVELKDPAFNMTVNRVSRYFYEMTDSDILEEIIGSYPVDSQIEASDVEHSEMVQFDCTDWDFINSRAEANGLIVIAEDGTVKIAKLDTSSKPALSLSYGATLMEFEASIDARRQYPSFTSESWDIANQEVISEEAGKPSFDEAGNLTSDDLIGTLAYESLSTRHSGRVSDKELKAWSDGKLYRSRLSKTLGRAKCQGIADIRPGNTISFTGVGERYNGSHVVTAIRHQLSTTNWTTDIRFGLPLDTFSDKTDVMSRPAAGLLPGVRGLQIGICTQLQDDPDGEERILVVLPLVDAESEGIWARIATLDAGENRGSVFRPEIGDELLVGFLNDDPRDPVVLGMLHSSAKPSPVEASDDNHEKGWQSRSEMKVMFNDDEVSFTIETPSGNKIVLSEDTGSITISDENGNSIAMNSDGIAIESAADISITASGDTTIEGVNCTTKASAEFKAEGSAGAEVSTSAIAKLKGSLVQIN